jgi:pseudouridine 5'-phosphatase
MHHKPAEREAAAHLLSFFPDLPPDFTIETYLTERREGQDRLWPTVQPLPGTVKLVQHLRKHNIPIAVATGSQRRNYEQKSAHLMDVLFGSFDGKVVCADDGLIPKGRGKPCPDVFLVTARTCLGRDVGEKEDDDVEVTERQRLERKKGLVFEDAIPGMQAGKRAGMNGARLNVCLIFVIPTDFPVIYV